MGYNYVSDEFDDDLMDEIKKLIIVHHKSRYGNFVFTLEEELGVKASEIIDDVEGAIDRWLKYSDRVYAIPEQFEISIERKLREKIKSFEASIEPGKLVINCVTYNSGVNITVSIKLERDDNLFEYKGEVYIISPKWARVFDRIVREAVEKINANIILKRGFW